MVNKKDLVIVALATFCLTATIFMVIPTRSSSGIGEYDAWNDLNGDGMIDIYDAINFAGTFNTAGDPTKNVNVTNQPVTSKTVCLLENLPLTWNVTNYPEIDGPQWIDVGNFSTAGYSRLRFSAKLTNCTNLGWNNGDRVLFYIRVNSTFDYGSSLEMDEGQLIAWEQNPPNGETFYPGLFPYGRPYPMLEVLAPYYTVTLIPNIAINRELPFPAIISCNLSLCVYLRNE